MVSLCLYYCGCDADMISRALECLQLGDFTGSVVQRIEDDRTVERLGEHKFGNREEIVRRMSLDGIKTTVTIRYFYGYPEEVQLQCNELLDLRSRKSLIVRNRDDRDISMSISSGILECHNFIEEKESNPSLRRNVYYWPTSSILLRRAF